MACKTGLGEVLASANPCSQFEGTKLNNKNGMSLLIGRLIGRLIWWECVPAEILVMRHGPAAVKVEGVPVTSK